MIVVDPGAPLGRPQSHRVLCPVGDSPGIHRDNTGAWIEGPMQLADNEPSRTQF